ncbi:MAG: thioredoxin domain-containing protein, partial [Verrucomicrobia bacterium]|nr:thioredoxin domain-containing protein [Verrucomicrobiota bacterium]
MPNALANESSPYLLQHANNPVDWLPWSDDAFARAARENKPVFLSIGYSTCHWCHVMEHESFENKSTAALMNEFFINIKVDREEMPDIDAAYMAFVQASTGQGGWPMSLWLTPAAEPILGGTYFPPEDRHGRAGFPRICREVARLWRENPRNMCDNASRMLGQLQAEAALPPESTRLEDEQVVTRFVQLCESQFDAGFGGFGYAPKFPRPSVLRTLMQVLDHPGLGHEGSRKAWEMVERTLAAMIRGGIHDQLGGGFHRYSVDRRWHIPHYEKMLYDQAQIADACFDAWQISGKMFYKETAEGIFRYLLGTMLDPGGAFHSAEDADSLPNESSVTKREGAFWTWTAEEISSLLDPRSALIFSLAYGVEAAGNAAPESDPHQELLGQNTLFRAITEQDLAEKFATSPEDIRTTLSSAAKILLEERTKRPAPHRDDKIIAAWNGLAISSLVRGARILDRPDLAEAASAAMAFIKKNLWDGEVLSRSYR